MSTRPTPSDERATARPVYIPTVIAAGCSDALLARCWDVLAPLGVMVRDCDAASLPTLAASRQPLVIVVPDALYRADADELEALARDVQAALIRVDERLDTRDFEMTLGLTVRASRQRREPRKTTGRYSILPGDPVPDLPAISSRPPVSGVHNIHADFAELADLEDELLSLAR